MLGVIIFIVVALFLVYVGTLAGKTDRQEHVKSRGSEQEASVDSSVDLSLGEKFFLGAGAAKLMEAEERRHQERKQEREQKRQNDLFWQDAARRKDPTYEDDDNW